MITKLRSFFTSVAFPILRRRRRAAGFELNKHPGGAAKDFSAIAGGITGLEPEREFIGFLLLGGVHHSLHLVPAAAALASSGEKVVLYVTSREEAAWCRDLLLRLGEPRVPIVPLLPPRWAGLAGKLNSRWTKPKAAILLANHKRLASLSALVVAERTSSLLKRLPGPKPFMIHIPHGAGDRAKGFEKRIRLFDHTIVAGRKDQRRMIREGLVSNLNCSVSGYIKAAAVAKMNIPVPHLFERSKKTVIYNPHFDLNLSSWRLFGREILEYFRRESKFNLIFAPHIRLWEFLSAREKSYLQTFDDCENIIVDACSSCLVDMTYIKYADIYIGDVSSQVYEFILTPRPCVFILPKRLELKGNQDYAHCRFGDVCFEPRELFTALVSSESRHALYKDSQRAGLTEAVGERWGSSIDFAAAIISEVVAKSKLCRFG